MEPLNMCMFATRVDYDAAVRKRWELLEQKSVAEKQQAIQSQKSQNVLTNNKIVSIMCPS